MNDKPAPEQRKIWLTTLELAALMMITLVLTIPFHVSAALAANVELTSIQSASAISGYRKMQDNTTFTAAVYTDSDTELNPSHVRLNNAPFDSCSNTGARAYQCSKEYSGRMNPGPFRFVLQLVEGLRVLATDTQTITVDGAGAGITLSISPERSTNGTVTIIYEASDTSHAGGTGCVGVGRIELFETDLTSSPFKTLTPNSASCTARGTEEYTQAQEGTTRICARAYDRFNQTSGDACSSFTIDRTAPQPQRAVLNDGNGNEIRLVTNREVPASIMVNISTDDGIGGIAGTITNINTRETYTNRIPRICTAYTDHVECIWDVTVLLNSTSTPSIAVVTVDSTGNRMETSLALNTIEVDSTGPRFAQITTDKHPVSGGSGYYAGSTTTFTADIREPNGISNDSIFLDLSGIGRSSTQVADGCTSKGGETYECVWNDILISMPTGTNAIVRGSPFSVDNLGNPSTELAPINITVDVDSPIAVSANMRIVKGENTFEQYLVRGDRLEINITMRDSGEYVIGTMNASQLMDVSPIMDVACVTLGNSTHSCVFLTPIIDISGPKEATIYFILKDDVGNEVRYHMPVFLSGLLEDAVQNHWTNTVICSPSKIDRQVTSLGNGQKMYCHVGLSPISTGAETLSIGLEDGACRPSTNDTNATSPLNYITSIQLLNNQRESRDPYLAIQLATMDMKVDSLDITCPLSIFSSVGNSITAIPEQEDVRFTVLFYNLPLGDLRKELNQKYKDAKEDATSGLWKVIEILSMIVRYARIICVLNNILQNLIGIYQTVTQQLGHVEAANKLNPVSGPPTHAARVKMCLATEGARDEGNKWFNIFNQFCNFVNCKMSLPGAGAGTFEKWSSWLGGGLGDKWIPQYYPGVGFLDKVTGMNYKTYMNGKESLAMSVLTLCLPGILYNLDKIRQIKCAKAVCLKDAITTGIPASACEELEETLMCKYVFGEIFQLIPFVALFDYYMNMIKAMLSDPFAIVGAILALTCLPHCANPISEGPHSACVWFKVVSMIGEVVGDVMFLMDENTWKAKGDYCRYLKDTKSKTDNSAKTDTDRVVV